MAQGDGGGPGEWRRYKRIEMVQGDGGRRGGGGEGGIYRGETGMPRLS